MLLILLLATTTIQRLFKDFFDMNKQKSEHEVFRNKSIILN